MNRMRKQILLAGAILVLVIAASAVAADVTGNGLQNSRVRMVRLGKPLLILRWLEQL